MEDSEIIALYVARDESAIWETEEKYGNYCLSIAHRILANYEDAQECLSDTLLRAWNAIPPARPTVFSVWLGKITRNLSLTRREAAMRLKRGGGEVDLAFSELTAVSGSGIPEEHLDVQQLAEDIGAYLKTAAPTARLAFIGRYYYFDSVSQIAVHLGISARQVSQLLYRTRKGLRQYLEKRGYSI